MEESYIEIEICCPTFARLCEKLNIFDGEDDSIYMLFEDVGYAKIQNNL